MDLYRPCNKQGCLHLVWGAQHMLTILFWMQPRIWLAFWAVRAPCSHMSPAIHWCTQVLFGRAVLHPYTPQPLLIAGAATSQVQALHLDVLYLVRFSWAHCSACPGLYVWHPVPGVCHLQTAEGALNPTVNVIEGIKEFWAQC